MAGSIASPCREDVLQYAHNEHIDEAAGFQPDVAMSREYQEKRRKIMESEGVLLKTLRRMRRTSRQILFLFLSPYLNTSCSK